MGVCVVAVWVWVGGCGEEEGWLRGDGGRWEGWRRGGGGGGVVWGGDAVYPVIQSSVELQFPVPDEI